MFSFGWPDIIVKRDAITQWASWFSNLWSSIPLLVTGIENPYMFQMANKFQDQDNQALSAFLALKMINMTLEDLPIKSETHSI